ncbi:hypothetical protein T01_6032 [Trichinella spiralis]|uniref:Uncharacterized protein n=1 Tax=Trichinella spiralis TaxID=6334 RepID=A0A0V1ATX4_TRISP|nr:hypothetical protein T01_6032 [Trichinella spiralis]
MFSITYDFLENVSNHVMVSYAVHRHCSASAIHKDDFLTSAKKGKMDLLNDLKTLNEGIRQRSDI